jgi:hypothetical protein
MTNSKNPNVKSMSNDKDQNHGAAEPQNHGATDGARPSLERWDSMEKPPYMKYALESNGFKSHPVRACHPPEASLASVGKAEAGSVDSEC